MRSGSRFTSFLTLLFVLIAIGALLSGPALAQLVDDNDPAWTWFMLAPDQTLAPGETASYYGRVTVFGGPGDATLNGLFIDSLLSPSPYFTIVGQNNAISPMTDTNAGLLDPTTFNVWLFDLQANADAPVGAFEAGSVTLRSDLENEWNLNPDHPEGCLDWFGKQQTHSFSASVVPEPASLTLLSAGALMLITLRRRRRGK